MKIILKQKKVYLKKNKDDSAINTNENSGTIYSYRDRNNNKKLYVFHYSYKDTFYLRCKDRSCKGTSKLENGLIFP